MKLTDSIHILRHDFEIQTGPAGKIPRFVNSLIVFGDNILLIDTGIKNSRQKIFDYIRGNDRKIEEIDQIILSHSHPDHMGSAAQIKRRTGCRILAHKNERNWIENIEHQAADRPVPGFFNLTDEPVKIDQFLTDRQGIRAGKDISLKIFHTPGHSKGSLSIFFKEAEMLFCADAVPVDNDIPNYDNYPDLISSLARIRKIPGYETLLTSWTQPVTSRWEIQQLIDQGESYLNRLDRAVKSQYRDKTDFSPDSCRKTISLMNLPEFYVNPIVDRAFRSHLE